MLIENGMYMHQYSCIYSVIVIVVGDRFQSAINESRVMKDGDS
jgi:hypothetical protein